jgi:carbamoyl-phosphate synthase large subunit
MTNDRGTNVLISSAGRRVELLRAFRQAVRDEAVEAGTGAGDRTPGRVLATDCSWYSSAFHDADEAFLVPRIDDPFFVDQMLRICEQNEVDLVIPTLDPELPVYAEARERFADVGTTVAVSSPEVVAISGDKQRTHEWLVTNGFPTVRQGSLADVLGNRDAWHFPLVVKPRFGSASIGVTFVNDIDQLQHAAAAQPDAVIQTLARGHEHTIDVLAARDGTCRATVPRRRLEVRAGEVSKAVTVRSAPLEELAAKLCEALPGTFGALNVQVFMSEDGSELAVIELNARFGGGFPLALAAGANFPGAMVQDVRRQPITATVDGWRSAVVMLRYDAAVFLDDTEGGDVARVS